MHYDTLQGSGTRGQPLVVSTSWGLRSDDPRSGPCRSNSTTGRLILHLQDERPGMCRAMESPAKQLAEPRGMHRLGCVSHRNAIVRWRCSSCNASTQLRRYLAHPETGRQQSKIQLDIAQMHCVSPALLARPSTRTPDDSVPSISPDTVLGLRDLLLAEELEEAHGNNQL